MGVVYRGVEISTQRPVAVKINHSGGDDQLVQRFMREARILSRLRSPHVVELLHFGEHTDGTLYLVMEYLDGKTIAEVVKHSGAIAVNRACHMAAQMALGLRAAHQEGVVHRDLKPANVMVVDHQGDPFFAKILDFGIAKPVGESKSGFTRTGMIMGTLEIMAPEQLTGDPVDERTDVYALGLLLYAMLTRSMPYAGTAEANLVYQIMNTLPQRPSRKMPDAEIPAVLDAIIFRCIAKHPEQRFANMEAFLDALERAGLAAVERNSLESESEVDFPVDDETAQASSTGMSQFPTMAVQSAMEVTQVTDQQARASATINSSKEPVDATSSDEGHPDPDMLSESALPTEKLQLPVRASHGRMVRRSGKNAALLDATVVPAGTDTASGKK
jgi:serine/threonine-protein kinase